MINKVNEKIKSIHPHLTILKYTNSKSVCLIQGDCGHTWTAMYSSIQGKKGGYTCRVCTPRVPNITSKTLSLEQANINLKIKYPDLVFLTYEGSKNTAKVRGGCGHIWENTPKNILSGHSGYICRVCTPAINSKLSLQEANNRLLNLFPDLEFMEYHGLQVPSSIRSKTCNHTWLTTLNNITTGNTPATCPNCFPRVHKISSGEKELVEYIKSIYNGWVVENDRTFIAPYELDIILPDKDLAIEYNGSYFHSEKFNDRPSLLTKTKLLDSMQLVHVSDEEWEHKKDIVKSRLASVLGIINTKIYARKCSVREISYPSDFLNTNHIQGAGTITSINLGLFYNNDLLSVMTFSKPRFTSSYQFELVRFCSKLFTSVPGGASKLFKYFIRKYCPLSIVSYSDKRWSIGNLYKKLEFTYSHTSTPNYRYVKSGSTTLSRYKCQKHLLENLFPKIYSESKSESEIMQEAGYFKIYDCGNDVWIYTNP